MLAAQSISYLFNSNEPNWSDSTHPDGKLLAVLYTNGILSIRELLSAASKKYSRVVDLAFSPDNKTFAALTSDDMIIIRNLYLDVKINSFDVKKCENSIHEKGVSSFSVNANDIVFSEQFSGSMTGHSSEGEVIFYLNYSDDQDKPGVAFNSTSTANVKRVPDRYGDPYSAIAFNGKDHDSGQSRLRTNEDIYTGLSQFTFSVWFNANKIKAEPVVLANQFDLFSNLLFGPRNIDNKVYFGVRLDNNWYDLISNKQVVPNEWYMITATYDGKTIKLYINDELQPNPVSAKGNITSGRYKGFDIGSERKNPIYTSFDGTIDDIEIYNYAIIAEQVSELYNGKPQIQISVKQQIEGGQKKVIRGEKRGSQIYDDFEDNQLNNDLWSRVYLDDSNTNYAMVEESGSLFAQPEAIAKRWIYSNGPNAIDWKLVPDGTVLYFDVSTMSCRGHNLIRFVDEFPTNTWVTKSDQKSGVIFWILQDNGCRSEWLNHEFEVTLFPSLNKIRFHSDVLNNTITSSNQYLDSSTPNESLIQIDPSLRNWYMQIVSSTGSAPEKTGFKINEITYDVGGVSGTEKKKSNYNQEVSPSDLIAYYPFNGNTKDESLNGHDGDNRGATLTSDRFGIENSAYKFDGSNDKIILDFNSSIFSENFSLAAWYFKTKSITGHPAMGIIANDVGSDRGIMMLVGQTNQTSFQFFNVERNTIGGYSQDILNDYQWYFSVFTFDGKTASWYTNGKLIGSKPFAGQPRGSGNFAIGWHPYDSLKERYWGGKIDDVRVYKKALSHSEVLALYHTNGWDK